MHIRMNRLASALLSTALLLLTTIFPGISPAQEVNQFTMPGTSGTPGIPGMQGTPGMPGTSLPSGLPSLPASLTPEQQQRMKGLLPQKQPDDKKAKEKEGLLPGRDEITPADKPKKILSPFEESIQGKAPLFVSTEVEQFGYSLF